MEQLERLRVENTRLLLKRAYSCKNGGLRRKLEHAIDCGDELEPFSEKSGEAMYCTCVHALYASRVHYFRCAIDSLKVLVVCYCQDTVYSARPILETCGLSNMQKVLLITWKVVNPSKIPVVNTNH